VGRLTPVATKESSAPSPKLPERLCTLRLRPTKRLQELRGLTGVRGGITAEGRANFQFDIRRKSGELRYVECMSVSANGDTIRISRRLPTEDGTNETDIQEYKYVTLPRTYYAKYDVAASFVTGLRKVTPKVTMHTREASCFLMENGPPANFEVRFTSSTVRITYHSSRNHITYERTSNEGGDDQQSFSYPLTSHQKKAFPLLQRFAELHEEVKEYVAEQENSQRSVKFPAVLGLKPLPPPQPPNVDYVLHKVQPLQVSPLPSAPKHQSTPVMASSVGSPSSQISTVPMASISDLPGSLDRRPPPSLLSSTQSRRSAKTFTFEDSSKVTLETLEDSLNPDKKEWVITYKDKNHKVHRRTLNEPMPEEMKEKALIAIEMLKNRNGQS